MSEIVRRSPSIFNFGRWIALWRYFLPQLKRQLISYGIASLLFAACLLLPLTGTEQLLIFVSISLASDMMFGLSPIAFAKFGDSRIIERLIPASTLEKFLFYFVYLLVIIPIIIKLPIFIAIKIYSHIPAIQTAELMLVFNKMNVMTGKWDYIINFAGNITILITCFYLVLTSRHNRVLKGIIGAFVAFVLISILGGVIGFTTASAAITNGDYGYEVPEEIRRSPQIIGLICAEWTYVIVIGGLIYRWLKRGAL